MSKIKLIKSKNVRENRGSFVFLDAHDVEEKKPLSETTVYTIGWKQADGEIGCVDAPEVEMYAMPFSMYIKRLIKEEKQETKTLASESNLS